MKAVQLRQFGIEHLHLTKLNEPEFGDHEVLVRTTAVALEYHDLLVVENRIPFGISLPHVPATEAVGVVERVGNKVSRWKKGDRVIIPFIPRWEAGNNSPYHDQLRTGFSVPGVLSEFTVQPETTLVRTPSNLTDEEAAPLSVGGLTVWAVLTEQANIRAGQTILIQGTGGVSLFALQIAKMFGLKVIATTGSKEKETKLRALGADEVINYKEFPEWSIEVKKLTGGLGVDVTLDVAGTETIEQSILSVKKHGFVGLIGLLTGTRLNIDIIPLITNYLRLQSYSVGNAAQLNDFVNAVEVNNLKPVIDSVYPLEKTQNAFYRFRSGDVFGKIVIKF